MEDKSKRSEVLLLLNTEIEHTKTEQYRHGITRWALLVGIATLVWKIVDITERAGYIVNNTILLMLLLCAVTAFTFRVAEMLLLPYSREIIIRDTRSLMSVKRGYILSHICVCVAILYITHSIKDLLTAVSLVALFALIIIHIAANTLTLVLSYFHLPIPVPGNRKIGVFLNVTFLLLAILSVQGIIGAFINIKPLSVDDVRLGLLYMSLLVLLILIVDKGSLPTVDDLIKVRRDLALDDVDLDKAKNEIRNILVSSSSSDFLKKELESLKDIIENIETNADNLVAEANKIISWESGVIPRIDCTIKACEMYSRKNKRLIEQLKNKSPIFKRKATWIKGLLASTKYANEITEVEDYYSSLLDRLEKKYEDVDLVLNNMGTAYNEYLCSVEKGGMPLNFRELNQEEGGN